MTFYTRQTCSGRWIIFLASTYFYVVKANAKTFEMVQTSSVQQELTKAKQLWGQIFPTELNFSGGRL